MIIVSRAPVRISFGGDGTDQLPYYERYGGLVVSTSINYYVYTILSPAKGTPVQIIATDYRPLTPGSTGEDLTWDNELSLPRAVTSYFDVREGVTVFLASQIPPGAGLGFSGSVTVSMIKALAFRCGLDLNPTEVAELACRIEIEKLGLPVSKQDPYAVAFGGLNTITFTKNGVSVRSLNLPLDTWQSLQRRLMLFLTGVSPISFTNLRYQTDDIRQEGSAVVERLHAIKKLSRSIRTALKRGNLHKFGELIHQSWLNKRELSDNVTNAFIDQSYATALKHGAVGGNLTGTGGEGFLLLYCPEDRQSAVTKALEVLGLRRLDFAFDMEGVQILQANHWEEIPCPLGGPTVSGTRRRRIWAGT